MYMYGSLLKKQWWPDVSSTDYVQWCHWMLGWNCQCGRTIRCTGGEKGTILTVMSALGASRARHNYLAIKKIKLKAGIRNDSLSNRSAKITAQKCQCEMQRKSQDKQRPLWKPCRSRTLEEETADRIGLQFNFA